MANDDAALALDPKTSALLVMDYQRRIVGRLAADAAAPLLERTARVLKAARAAGLRVLYVVVGFRHGYPEAGPGNAAVNTVKASGAFLPDDPGVAIPPEVAPEPGEVTVTKHRVNAFHGTDLDMILRANRIEDAHPARHRHRRRRPLHPPPRRRRRLPLPGRRGLLRGCRPGGARLPDGEGLPSAGEGDRVGGPDRGAGPVGLSQIHWNRSLTYGRIW